MANCYVAGIYSDIYSENLYSYIVTGIYSEICVQRIFYIYGIHSDIFRYLYIFRDINIGIYSDILGIFIMVYIQIHSDIFRYSEIYITSEIFICA